MVLLFLSSRQTGGSQASLLRIASFGSFLVFSRVLRVQTRVIYIKMGRKLFPKGMPPPEVIWDQIQLAQLSTTIYAMLPVLGEFFIEEGYTR